ncbi:MAG TPA: DUF4436 family protein, partial [Pyrinomonadaceae bacterium]
MPLSNKLSTRDIVVGVALLVVFAVALFVVLRIYKGEGEKRSAVISEEGEKNPNHIETFVKLLSVDPVKGDTTTRIEFIPHGTYAKEDGSLAQNLKLFVNSANGKQEHDFPKGKRMNPVEVVVNMYDGLVTDYPFDRHSAFLEIYFTGAGAPQGSGQKQGSTGGAGESSERKEAASPPANPAQAPSPAAAKSDEQPGGAKKEGGGGEKGAGAGEEDEVPIAVDFFGSIAGYRIDAAKSKESDDAYVGIDMTISRSSTVVFFSLFV